MGKKTKCKNCPWTYGVLLWNEPKTQKISLRERRELCNFLTWKAREPVAFVSQDTAVSVSSTALVVKHGGAVPALSGPLLDASRPAGGGALRPAAGEPPIWKKTPKRLLQVFLIMTTNHAIPALSFFSHLKYRENHHSYDTFLRETLARVPGPRSIFL